MKIAIITHSLRYNYGGILQNYALQRLLLSWGHEVITLKLKRRRVFWQECEWMLKYYIHKLLGQRAVPPLLMKDVDLICRNTDRFINKYIRMGPKMDLIDYEWLRKKSFDAIIIGSDQVLHPQSYRKIEDIYLGFIENVVKIIYAGSFGSEKWFYTPSQELACARSLKKFRAISSRENSGINFFKKKFGVSAQLVLDPTLLLEGSEYERFVLKTNHKSMKKVVTYFLDPNREKEEIVEKVCALLGGQRETAGNEWMDNAFLRAEERIADSVEDWLSRLYNADFIITDSFHGTCFSIIFKKNFITVANKQRGLDRFVTLLSELGLNDRLLYTVDNLSSELVKDIINYEEVNRKLTSLKIKSLAFLRNALVP